MQSKIRTRVIASFAALTAACLLVTSGCGGEDGGTTPTDNTSGDTTDQPIIDGVLQPDNTLGTDVAAVSAAQGALNAPVAISADTTDDPTGSTPLPPEATPVGEFLEIASGRDVNISSDHLPLYVAIPVPDSAETSNLALAMRPGGDTSGHQSPDAGPTWSVLDGLYDPDPGLFVVPIRFLISSGTTVTLVESDDYQPVVLEGSSDTDGASETSSLVDASGEPTESLLSTINDVKSRLNSASIQDDFYVVCRGFSDGGCDDATKQAVRSQLASAWSSFSSGFQAPALRRTLPGRTVDGTDGRFYKYVLRPTNSVAPCARADGHFAPTTRLAVTCHDPSSNAPPEAPTREMFFHAVQYGYSFFDWTHDQKSRASWLLEGPAAWTKNTNSSADNAARWNRASDASDLRKIDTPLTARTGSSPLPAAGTQDFWVYMMNQRQSLPRDFLPPIWESQPDEAPTYHDVETIYDLTPAHWGWVKNQAFESRVVAGNSDLNGTCVPNPKAWSSLERTITVDAANQTSFSQQIELDGDWKADVVKIEIQNGTAGDVRAKLFGSSDDGYLKAYPARSSPSQNCLYRTKGPSRTEISAVLGQGDVWETYVLVSNSSQGGPETRSYDLQVDFETSSSDQESPLVSVMKPPATDYPLQRDTLFLEANASDPGGGFVEPLQWTVTGSGDTSKTYTGDDLAIDDFWDEGFQPGTFTFEIYAVDDDGQESTVTFQADIEMK